MIRLFRFVTLAVGSLGMIASEAVSQAWVAQTSGVSTTLACVSFAGKDTGSVCGTSGVILRTTNGGTTWISQTSGTANSLNWIRLFSANVGTAVGNSGTIRRTTDGGSSWTSQTSGTSNDLFEAFFVDASIAFIVGESGTILKTTNAGSTWTTLTSGTTNDLNGVYFTSSTNGVVIGASGTIRRTTNGGTSWTSITSGTTQLLHEARFWTADSGIIIGLSGVVLTTTNNGASWTAQTSGTSTNLVGLALPDANTAIVTGGSGLIRRSTDRGVTWASQTSGTSSSLNEVSFPTSLIGTAVGGSGTIRKTFTGGEVIPLWSVNPSSIAFGSVAVGASKMDSVTVTNTGIATLTISSITSSNAQFTVSPSSGSIAASGSQKFYITYTPSATGAAAANVIFNHDAPGTPDTVSVTGTGVAPGWSVSPTSIPFGNVLVGASKMDSVTVTNTGTSALNISAVISNNARFTVSPSSGSIAPSGTQKFYITFGPTATGAQAGSIIFTHDAAGSPDTVSVTGTGVAPGWSVSPTSIPFGNVLVGASKMDSVTVTNTGTSTLNISTATSSNARFTVSPSSGSIAPSGTQKFYITFSPTAVGAQLGSVIFTHDATGSPDTVAVTGNGVAPGWSVSPTSIPFGNVLVGASKMDSVTVTNTGTSALNISAVISNNARFTVSPSSGSIAPSGTQRFYITFSPTATGAQAGSIIFTHDATGSPDTVSVTGTGVAPGWSVSPTSIPFGNVLVGASKMDSVTVTNTGTSTLTISGVTSSNARFTVSPSSGSIAPSGTQRFYITFSPTATGAQAGSIIFTHDATGSPDTVSVTGTGVTPGWSVSPSSVAFGNVVVNESKMDSVTVTNTGTSTLSISAVTSNNARFTVSPSSGSIAPSGTQKFYITFSPIATGGQAGDIIFTHDAMGSPDTVSVSGNGVQPGFFVSPNSLDFANVVVGTSVLDSVIVTNTGTSTLNLSAVSSDNAEFTVSPGSASIPPSGTQSFHITFAPTNTGGESGNIIFTHDAPGAEVITTLDTVSVAGVGVAPGWSVSPTSIPFGNVVVGNSKMDSVTVTNTGTSALNISAATSSNPRFSVSPGSGSIPPSGSQKFYITFNPIATGGQAGSIIFTHDATGSPDTVSVTGTGVAPAWLVAPGSLAFGNVVVGASKMDSVTVTNTGTSTLTVSTVNSNNARFTVSPGSGSIPPLGSQKFYITFSPTATGNENGDIIFTHDATGSPDTVTVSGTGVAPEFAVTPLSVSFGNVVVGSSLMDSVTVTNSGTSTLTINSAGSDNPRFGVSPGSSSIPASSSQKFYITFTPVGPGAQAGNIIFTHDAQGSPDSVAVDGTGVEPGFLVNPAVVSFDTVVIGQSKLDSVTVTNTGTSTLTITSVASTNPRFSVSPGSGIIAPAGSMKFYLTFTPTTASFQSGDIVFMHSASGSPDTVTVSGTGVLPTYIIVATADSGGTITPSGSIPVAEGNNQSFTIAANTGYHIDSVVVDGVNQGVITNYTFTNVTAGHAISAYFSINTYLITASAGANGSIAPSGSISVNHGSNQGFTIAADSGYHIDSVVVDGVDQGPLPSYTFTNVTANHSIAAYFSITNYTITASADSGGAISPSGLIGVASGGSQSFTIVPDTGYHIDSVVVDGLNQGAITGYTFNNVLANHTIAAYFSINTYTIAATAGPNGGIAPAGITTVNFGAGQSYTIIPNTGYHIDSVLVDGVNQGVITNYTFTNVAANHTIAAYFSINAYTIVAGVSGNGTITPSGNVPVNHGANQLFVITPSFYHHVDSVYVDGVNIGSTTVYTFSNVVTNHSITAFISMDYITFVSMSPETVYNADPVKGRPKRPAKRGKHQFPNWTNLLDETVQQGGFAPGTPESDSGGGAVIGISHMLRRSPDPLRPQWKPQRDSAKVRAWVRLTKWDFRRRIGRVSLSARGREFQRTLKDNTGFHTGPPGGLDSTTDGRGVRLVKQLRRVTPRVHSNKLYAEQVTLKLNIAASQLGKTPAGFGDLIYDVDGNAFDEMSVMQISERADSMMTYWQGVSQTDFDSVYSAIYAINRSFVCPLDTITFETTDSFYVNGKLTLNGTTEIADVPFLKMPVPFTPTRIAAQNPEVDVDETADFDSDDEDEYDEDEIPVAARVYQNYPNPFNPSTSIAFELQEESAVTIKVFNMLGQEVATLANNEELEEGIQSFEFTASGLASGVYFYRVEARGLGENGLRTVETRKMILMK